MDIKAFFKDARRRGLPKGTSRPDSAPVPAPEPGIDPSEANLVQAAMGFNFKCGVCHKNHKSSNREKVKGLGMCVGKILKEFGEKNSIFRNKRCGVEYGDKNPSSGFGVRFLPDPATADTMVFTFKQYSAFSEVVPTSSAVEVLYPTLKKRFTNLLTRLNEVFNREIIEELSIKEALGAPSTIPYIRAREKSFRERATEEFAKIKKDQEAFDPETFELARNWRKLPPEKFKVGEALRGYGTGSGSVNNWFKGAAPSIEPIKTVEINRKEQSADTIFGWFTTMSGNPVWDTNHTRNNAKVLYDVGVVDGLPAISWGIVGARDTGGSKRTVNKGSTVINFISLWNGKMFLNMYGWGEDFSLSDFDKNRARYVSVSPEAEALVVDQAD